MSSLTEIFFRLFAWVRPLLWYYHRIGHVLEAFLISLERPSVVARVRHDPAKRRQWAAIILDLEHGLDIAIGLRTRELLGQPIAPEARPGLRQRNLIHIRRTPGFDELMQRLARLIERYCDLERLAQLRAQRIRREIDTAPVRLTADHRPQGIQPSLMMIAASSPCQASSCIFAIPTAGLRIRAPP